MRIAWLGIQVVELFKLLIDFATEELSISTMPIIILSWLNDNVRSMLLWWFNNIFKYFGTFVSIINWWIKPNEFGVIWYGAFNIAFNIKNIIITVLLISILESSLYSPKLLLHRGVQVATILNANIC